MNVSHELLERLIDDELTPQERTRVLRELAAEADGWERLSRTFLDAQVIAGGCRAYLADALIEAQPLVALSTTKPGSAKRAAIAAVTALALTFLLGIWLGQVTARDSGAGLAGQADLPMAPSLAGEAAKGAPPLYSVVLGDAQSGYTTLTIPVYNSADAVPDEWKEVPPTVRLLQQALAGPGRQLEAREDWVPIVLADGQQGMMPIREWSIRQTSRAEYP